jgi:carbon-monoxide dehydrogenase medium subunit
MIPASFEYETAESPAHALQLLAEHGDEAKLLAGGHSLLPMMKVRLAMPAVLIDIARLTELSGIRTDGEELVIGATTRHAEVASSDLVKAEVPILAYAAAQVGDPQIRPRSTGRWRSPARTGPGRCPCRSSSRASSRPPWRRTRC